MTRPDSVLMNEFLNEHGYLRALVDLTFPELAEYHGIRNRFRYERGMFCTGCQRPAHLVQFRGSNRFAVRHNPGEGGGKCELDDVYRSYGPGVSEEHAKAGATIVVATRDHDGWSAEPEHTIPYSGIRADVYAWHQKASQPYQKPIVWEVQLSGQIYQETVARTIQRQEADDAARVFWVTPSKNTVTPTLADPEPPVPVYGLVTDADAVNIVDRAYLTLEPRIPLDITLKQAVKGLIRPTRRLSFIEWEDDDTGEPCYVLYDEAAGSTIQPPPRRPRPELPDVVDPIGCTRPRIELPPWIRPLGPILEQQLPYELDRPTAPTPAGPRARCQICDDEMPAYALAVHLSLRHPNRETR